MQILKHVFFTTAFALSLQSAPIVAADYFTNGQEADQVTTPGRVQSEGQVEAVEFFWYGCPHCAAFEPSLEDWVAQLPKNVAFIRLPASWNDSMTAQQRLYFTLAKLNRLDLHTAVFDAIHKQRISLNTPAAIEKWAVSQKINLTKWRKAYNSEQVTEQTQGAQAAFMRFELNAVPMMVINGKYVINFTPNVLIRADQMVRQELETLQTPPSSPSK
ncbi:thiol:disulfide interchange protein DsbA/DsbL [Hydromonas duriensis]|uniref:Thiol:disulfide interchange protein n=1 Tax=Hydromonas duriensis TaxID=1527608 RepID=A0A4R6Y374_9BURK|nr:thiol:disulfide interchange protein DsbA/DsbL [Hydromonas duriensis]TDR30996.1 thiol:disulfide interchange protein DsbA [Hydromonas duriensis]